MTISSMFVGNVVLLIVMVGQGEMAYTWLPLLGGLVTGSGITRLLLVPESRRNLMDD